MSILGVVIVLHPPLIFKQVVTDLKMIHTAVTLDEAENALLQFGKNGKF